MRVFLSYLPVMPEDGGSHSFFIHTAHFCRSAKLNKLTFMDTSIQFGMKLKTKDWFCAGFSLLSPQISWYIKLLWHKKRKAHKHFRWRYEWKENIWSECLSANLQSAVQNILCLFATQLSDTNETRYKSYQAVLLSVLLGKYIKYFCITQIIFVM